MEAQTKLRGAVRRTIFAVTAVSGFAACGGPSTNADGFVDAAPAVPDANVSGVPIPGGAWRSLQALLGVRFLSRRTPQIRYTRLMASLKKTLLKQGEKLISDPRVAKLMQDERVMKAIMAAVAVPGRVQSFTHEQSEKIAKAMALATEDEVKDLRRTVRRLEEELDDMRAKKK